MVVVKIDYVGNYLSEMCEVVGYKCVVGVVGFYGLY